MTIYPKSVFDKEKATLRAGQESTLVGLAQFFPSYMSGLLEKLDVEIGAENLAAVAESAHKIKGAVGNLAADQAMDAAAAIEAASKSEDRKLVHDCRDALHREIDLLINALDELVKK